MEKKCSCSNYSHYFWIERAKVSQLIAFCVICVICIFAAGFFWGKQKAMDMLAQDLQQDAFADQVEHSMILLYDKQISSPVQANQSDSAEASVQPAGGAAPLLEKYAMHINKFAGLKAAQECVAQLQKKGIRSTIIKRESKQRDTKKIVPWYQVVTQTYDNKQELDSNFAIIKAMKPQLMVHVIKK
jgi:hypothetical protein